MTLKDWFFKSIQEWLLKWIQKLFSEWTCRKPRPMGLALMLLGLAFLGLLVWDQYKPGRPHLYRPVDVNIPFCDEGAKSNGEQVAGAGVKVRLHHYTVVNPSASEIEDLKLWLKFPRDVGSKVVFDLGPGLKLDRRDEEPKVVRICPDNAGGKLGSYRILRATVSDVSGSANVPQHDNCAAIVTSDGGPFFVESDSDFEALIWGSTWRKAVTVVLGVFAVVLGIPLTVLTRKPSGALSQMVKDKMERASDLSHPQADLQVSQPSSADSWTWSWSSPPTDPVRLPSIGIEGGKQRFDAFLCHVAEDKDAAVTPFALELARQGLKPWVEEGQIKPGDRILEKIDLGLMEARFVVVFLSEAFLSKSWPEEELQAAMSRKSGGRPVIVPVVIGLALEEIKARHPFIAGIDCICVREYDCRSKLPRLTVRRLVRALRRRVQDLP